MYQKTGYSQSATHSRPAECGSRQAIQAMPDHSNRVVSPPRGLPSSMQQVAQASDRPFLQQGSTTNWLSLFHQYRTPWPGQSMHSACHGRIWTICLSTSSHLGQSDGEVTGRPVQENDFDCSKVAQHALVLGSGDHVQPDPTVLAQPTQPSHTTIQTPHRNLSKLNLHAWLLEPQQVGSRASLRQWKHE